VIRFSNVYKAYPNGAMALKDVSFHVSKGEFVFLTGHSGAGKSTIMKMLFAEQRPSGGEVRVSGHNVTTLRPDDVPRLRRRLGVVFQDFRLLEDRTAAENIAFALEVTGARTDTIAARVMRVLTQVGLSSKARAYPRELSGGEQQRVAIARALVNDPAILLADEPTGNLDPVTSIGIMQLLYRINRTGTTVLVATHDREMVDKMRRRVMALDEGRLVRDEATAGYADESTSEFALRVRAEMGVGAGHVTGS
jgi:cell division transport system ATP-binding protein